MNKWKLVFSVLSVAISAQFSSGAAQAVEACDTIESCRALQTEVEARLAVLKGVPNLGDVPRNEVGLAVRMYRDDAASYCRDQGERLPTARELAAVAQSLGAKGISETPKPGYYLVKPQNDQGGYFYFNNEGYQRPSGDLGELSFWSSSLPPYNPYVPKPAYTLNGEYGFIENVFRSALKVGDSYAVRCVRSSPAPQPSEVCAAINSCRALETKVEARLAELLKDGLPNLGDFARRSDGKVWDSTQYGADSYCHNRGERPPTARELALVARSLGAQGISETEKEGYQLVKGADSAGNPDHFYFNRKGYRRPSGDIGSYLLWSSSVDNDFAYILAGGNGEILREYRSNTYRYNGAIGYHATRCVRSR